MHRMPQAKISAQDVASYLENYHIELKHSQLLEVVARSRGFKNYHVLKNQIHLENEEVSFDSIIHNQLEQSEINTDEFAQWLVSNGLSQLINLFMQKNTGTITLSAEQFQVLKESSFMLESVRRRVEGEYVKPQVNSSSKAIRDVILAVEYPRGITPPLLFQANQPFKKASPAHASNSSFSFTSHHLGDNDDSIPIQIDSEPDIEKQAQAIDEFLKHTHDSRFFVKNGAELWKFLCLNPQFNHVSFNNQDYAVSFNLKRETLNFTSYSNSNSHTHNDKNSNNQNLQTKGTDYFELESEKFLNATYLDAGQWLIHHLGVMSFDNGEVNLVSSAFHVEPEQHEHEPYVVIHEDGLAYEDIHSLEQAKNTAEMLANEYTGTLSYVEDIMGRCIYMSVDGFIPSRQFIGKKRKLF
jgi:hypothetical protein